jgi:hypothetical protein
VASCHKTDWSSFASHPDLLFDFLFAFPLSSFDQIVTSANRNAFDFALFILVLLFAFCYALFCSVLFCSVLLCSALLEIAQCPEDIFSFFLHHYILDFWLMNLQYHFELSFLSCFREVILRFNLLIVFCHPYVFSFLLINLTCKMMISFRLMSSLYNILISSNSHLFLSNSDLFPSNSPYRAST